MLPKSICDALVGALEQYFDLARRDDTGWLAQQDGRRLGLLDDAVAAEPLGGVHGEIAAAAQRSPGVVNFGAQFGDAEAGGDADGQAIGVTEAALFDPEANPLGDRAGRGQRSL